jgi:nitroreductase/NAD-dependent dihydropyrimidine dehydrogenase PreA subunit
MFMPLITIDAELCSRDGICAAECPMRIIQFDTKNDAVPTLINGAEPLCIDCGHCVAVCPTAALSHRSHSPETCPPVNSNWRLSPEQTEHFLRSRRSIRNYRKKPVSRHDMEKLLDMARYAPSAHNLQPVKWLVVEGPDKVKELTAHVVDWMRFMITDHPEMAGPMHLDMIVAGWEKGIDVICRDAPAMVLAYAGKKDRTAPAACTLAMAYLELAAPGLGLGSCWAGYFGTAAAQWKGLQEALGLPEGTATYAAMMVGYPRFAYHRMPNRKPLDVAWV